MQNDQKKEKSKVDRSASRRNKKKAAEPEGCHVLRESGMVCVCTVNLSKSSIIRSCMTVTLNTIWWFANVRERLVSKQAMQKFGAEKC
jgi:hypothetical protein